MRDNVTLRAVGKHIARFILVGLYTGTRSSAICGAALMPTVGRGYVDLGTKKDCTDGVFYRRAIGRRATKKRQPPVRLPPKLVRHLRRWRDRGISKTAVVEWNGKPIASIRKGFEAAMQAAGLGPDVTPHILRHTCATWLMQSGRVETWEAAGFLGMTVKQLEETYGHHHPDFQNEAANALRGQYAARNPVNKIRVSAANGAKIRGISK
jgi:integrase